MNNLSARKVDYKMYEDLGVQILGISVASKFSQKSFADSLKLPYPLLSDFPNASTILNYDVAQFVGPTKRVMARQSFFLVDKKGVVRGRWAKPPGKDGKFANDDLFPSAPILKLARQLRNEG